MRLFNWFGLFGLANLFIGFFIKFDVMLYTGLAVVLFWISAQVFFNEITDKKITESPYEIMEVPIYTTIKGDKEFIDEDTIRNVFEIKLKERGRK